MNVPGIHHQSYIDLFNALEDRHYNCLLGNPGIAPGSDTDKIKITNAFHYRLNGIEYYKAAADDVIAPESTEAGEFRKDVVCIDAAGTVTLVSGDVAESQEDAELPEIPSTKLALAYLEIPESFVKETTDVTTGMIKRLTSTIVPTGTVPTTEAHTHSAEDIGTGVVSNTEFSFLNGVTSAIQTQLDAKIAMPESVAAGDIFYHDGTAVVRLAKGAAGQVLTMNAGATAPEWATPS